MRRKKSGHRCTTKGKRVKVWLEDGTTLIDHFEEPGRNHQVRLRRNGWVRITRLSHYRPQRPVLGS